MPRQIRITTAEAAAIARCSESTIRKRLTPVEIEEVHVRYRGTRYAYRYSKRDAENLRDGKPVRERKHPDPEVARELSRRAEQASEIRNVGRVVASRASELEIRIPADTPTCCQRHALACVRHEGTDYDSVLQYRRDAKQFSSADAGYSTLKAKLHARIERLLVEQQKWPEVADCTTN